MPKLGNACLLFLVSTPLTKQFQKKKILFFFILHILFENVLLQSISPAIGSTSPSGRVKGLF